MADQIKVLDLDFVFISYKEPNCEENYADLLSKVPWAKRVHGVEGFDSAHKAAAELAETDFFISVDGDNVIDESFLLQTLDWSRTDPKAVHRWRAENSVNGLIYGNGGLVGWHKDTCFGMKTHENSDSEENDIDFCWGVPHANLHNVYSRTIINSSQEQAFTAGFREGVKMSLDRGKVILPTEFMQKVYKPNLRCLTTWQTVGADVEHGRYAMLGARTGCWHTLVKGFQPTITRNLDHILDLFYRMDGELDELIRTYGNSLRQRLGIPMADYDAEASRFFKFCQPQWINRGVQDLENK